jgi:hypothetical protein
MLLPLMALLLSLWSTSARADQPDGSAVGADYGLFKDKAEEKQEDKTAEQKAAEEEAERKRKEKLARVIVLKWKDTTTDYKDETVRRNVRSRIARPEGMFFPEVDLYQNGRKVLDRTVIPAMQPAVVPDANIGVVKAAVDQIAGVPWNQMQPAEWGLKAQELRALAEQLWFVDRVALREPLFLLYSQIGRAAENQNHSAPPFYEQVGSFAVNYYFYLAATLAYQEPSLMSKLTDQELSGSIGYYLQQLQQGSFPSLKVDFEQENSWNEEEFNKDYEVLVNGIAVVPDGNAQIDVFLGRTDIYLKRKDTGHGLSERLEVAKLDDKIYAVREVARKLMGIDFIDQLFLHKNECTPQVDGNILNYLAIYAKLHDKAEIYIAVPEFGNPNKMWIWRYDRPSAQLSLVGGGGDGFPVRFALVFSTGLLSNGATVAVDDDLSDESDLSPDRLADANRINTELDSATIPFNFELRGHYNRLMVNLGAEFGYNASGDADGWIEYYQTPGKNSNDDIHTYEETNCVEAEDGTVTCRDLTEVYNERTFSRNLYLGVGIVLGRDAGIGFGPRFAFRWDWANMPHGWQPTLHFGWALQPPIFKAGGRVRPLVDLDLRGGVNIDRDRSIHKDIADELDDDEGTVMPLFGATLGVGLTF